MKNKFFKGFMSIAFLFVSFASFAGPGGPDGTPDENPAADIDSKLIVLAVLGIAFAAYMLMQKRKQVKA
ncbi:MAG TPA: hypothetical protein VLZ11_05075 [Flavobacterium sp.]|nr:hypothetical protein [Flavobacterium sp.]